MVQGREMKKAGTNKVNGFHIEGADMFNHSMGEQADCGLFRDRIWAEATPGEGSEAWHLRSGFGTAELEIPNTKQSRAPVL